MIRKIGAAAQTVRVWTSINHSLTMCVQAQNDLRSFILGRRANARGGSMEQRHVYA